MPQDGLIADDSDHSLDDDNEYTFSAEAYDQPLALVTRRALTIQGAPDSSQREHLFHTRCKIEDATCSVIVDGGSCCNIISKRVV